MNGEICPHPSCSPQGATVYTQVKSISVEKFSASRSPLAPLTKGGIRVQSPPEFGGFRGIDRLPLIRVRCVYTVAQGRGNKSSSSLLPDLTTTQGNVTTQGEGTRVLAPFSLGRRVGAEGKSYSNPATPLLIRSRFKGEVW